MNTGRLSEMQLRTRSLGVKSQAKASRPRSVCMASSIITVSFASFFAALLSPMFPLDKNPRPGTIVASLAGSAPEVCPGRGCFFVDNLATGAHSALIAHRRQPRQPLFAGLFWLWPNVPDGTTYDAGDGLPYLRRLPLSVDHP